MSSLNGKNHTGLQFDESKLYDFMTSFEKLSQEDRLFIARLIWTSSDASNIISRHPNGFRLILKMLAFSIDLETDGEDIWEIGSAQAGKGFMSYSRKNEENLVLSLAAVSNSVKKSPIVVGQNIISWDWPIISKKSNLTYEPLLWDTLIIQWMFTPGRRSLALNGAHRADSDALDSLNLFYDQLDILPPVIAQGILDSRFSNTSELLSAISRLLYDLVDYSADIPEWLLSSHDKRTLLISGKQIHDLDWVPGISIVNADSSSDLEFSLRVIDVERLEDLLSGLLEDPKHLALLTVIRIAKRMGISVRRSMIPAWIADFSSDLGNLLDKACIIPSKSFDDINVSVIPDSVEWWSTASTQDFRIAASSVDALIIDRQNGKWSDIVSFPIKSSRATLLRVSKNESMSHWMVADRAGQMLDINGGWSSFKTLSIDPAFLSEALHLSAMKQKPKLGFSRSTSLHPNSIDQASYWINMIQYFKEVSSNVEGVPILLVSSSCSETLITLIEAALSELGIGEIKPAHRSRYEHIKRSAEKKLALVGFIEDWDSWHAYASSQGISLSPVLEALPFEEWYAISSIGSQTPGVSNQDLMEVFPSVILDSVPKLVRENLMPWLVSRKIGSFNEPAIVLDTRLGLLARELDDNFSRMPLFVSPLLEKQLRALKKAFSPLSLRIENAPDDMESMERFFIDHWAPPSLIGDESTFGFKPSQRVAMEVICNRSSNVLVRLPTGEGKSVLFQVPGLCRGLRNRKLTLVISPLRALMKDQVEDLWSRGFEESADYMSGDRTPGENQEVLQGILEGRIVLLYVAPERLRSKSFFDVLERRMASDGGLEYVVVDEAHCLNQWGLEFRPDYFFATETLMEACRGVNSQERCPFIFLSATITLSDRKQIMNMLPSLGSEKERLPFVMRPEGFSQPVRSHIKILPKKMSDRISLMEFEVTIQERLPTLVEVIEKSQHNRALTGQRSAVIVFVNSRKMAEKLAELLSEMTLAHCDFFHARMDATRKQEVYAEFKDGEIDVLVATKAFGMGMDIPDIHWSIHLSPPPFLDDFLQEIGRIGRNAEKRELAKLEKLEAILLFSSADFSHSRGMRIVNALKPQDIDALFRAMHENSERANGHSMAMVPAIGYFPLEKDNDSEREAAINKTRMGIYWLERSGAVTLCESIADVIPIEMDPDLLKPMTKRSGPIAELSSLILGMSSLESLPATHVLKEDKKEIVNKPYEDSRSVLKRFLSSISDMVGFVFGNRDASQVKNTSPIVEPITTSSSPQKPVSAKANENKMTAVVNLGQISAQSRMMRSVDDVWAALSDLQRLGAVDLKREIQFSRRILATELQTNIQSLFDLIDSASMKVAVGAATQEIFLFQPMNLIDCDIFRNMAENYSTDSNVSPGKSKNDLIIRRKKMFEKSFVNGFRSLVRSSGVRIKQILGDNNELFWEATLPHSYLWKVDERRKFLLAAAKSILSVVNRADKVISLSDLIDGVRKENPQKKFHEDDLKKVAGILSAMRLVGMSVDLVEFSHIVMLNQPVSYNDGETESSWESELIEVNEMADARMLATEVFASLRSEAREVFIDGYFSCETSTQLKEFLETQLGDVADEGDDGVASELIIRMRERLRSTKVVEFFARYNSRDAEEPVQWEVMSHPYDQHLLVNAGPGAGKTSVLVGRVVHLIREQHIDPSKIVVLAFNRAVVSEIKLRVKTLFQSLGYAAYASRLRVSTVHSFAIRHLGREKERPKDAKMDDILNEFASRMSSDANFRKQVSGDLCCILVDEFQDVTEPIYSIVHSLYLGSGSRAGVMVIGDDDQDILRWQRNGDFCETFFERFENDFGDRLSKKLLSVNFRSNTAIVLKSQEMISGFFDSRTRSRRLKDSLLLAKKDANIEECVSRIDWTGKTMDEACSQALSIWKEKVQGSGESISFLCRSNAEVAEVHRLLKPLIPDLAVQGIERLRVSSMRHVAAWLDVLRSELIDRDRILTKDVVDKLLAEFRLSVEIPENKMTSGPWITIEELNKFAFQEQSSTRLSDLISFIEEMNSEDIGRLRGSAFDARAVVSTIHKVKGLEYDHVIVLPSYMPFGGESDICGDAAEEARILYVAMTRAKKSLTYFVGDRELSWGRSQPRPYKGRKENGRILVGSAEDVGLSWSMTKIERYNMDPDLCQEYIEKNIKAGDRILLGGQGAGAFKGLFHESDDGSRKQIGFLAKRHNAGGPNADLVVSSVIRFQPDDIDIERYARCVVERGWGYAVLVSGLLR
jgi:RecQ family ATP-dependent DNA helicase